MKKSLFSPLATWKNFAKVPVTIQYPKEDLDVFDKPGASPSYRGLHTNDLAKCVGCGTCEDICPTNAIRMVPGPNEGPGKKGVIPEIDYGRCCFCGFCVDVCTSGSLSMSRDYIQTAAHPLDKIGDAELREIKQVFTVAPNEEHGENPGHSTDDEESWLDLERIEMEEIPTSERVESFMEVVRGFSREQAHKEASRCVECELCVDTCPAHMEIPKYIKAIWQDDLKQAVEIMYHTNPLPGICGRVCTHKCETVCSMSLRGEPVAIRWLKRYAVDNLPEEEYRKVIAQEIVRKEQKVAVVGSGPSGLAAAYYLSLAGYQVTIFEALSKAGGMMRVGVPKYRLPDSAISRDIDHIVSLGAEIRLNTRVGRDVSLGELHEQFDAVYISTGLHLGRPLGFDAEKLSHVRQSIDLLREFRLTGEMPTAERVAIIGGGNVAMDIARTMARLQKSRYGKVHVVLASLETRDIMPADEEEIIESGEEGVEIHPGWGPADIQTDGDRVTGIEFKRCIQVFDEEKRFSPRFDEDDRIKFEVDMVVESVGQASDMSYIDKELIEKIEMTPRRQVKVSDEGQTSLPWLFAGGDIVHGPDAITAIADGHAAARGIEAYLNGGH